MLLDELPFPGGVVGIHSLETGGEFRGQWEKGVWYFSEPLSRRLFGIKAGEISQAKTVMCLL